MLVLFLVSLFASGGCNWPWPCDQQTCDKFRLDIDAAKTELPKCMKTERIKYEVLF